MNKDTEPILDLASPDLSRSATSEPAIKQGWLRALLYFIAFFFSLLISQVIFLVLKMIFTDQSMDVAMAPNMTSSIEISWMAFSQLLSFSLAFFLAWIFMKFIDKRPIMELGLNFKMADSISGFLGGILLISCGFLFLWLGKWLEVIEVNFDFLDILLLFLLFFFVAWNEEFTVRGYILNNLMQSMPSWIALYISAVIFTIMHALNPNVSFLGIINIFLAGLLLGIYYVHKKNLWFPVMLHLSWNFFQGPIYGFEVSGLEMPYLIGQKISGPDYITGGSFGFEGSLILTIMLILSITTIHFIYRPKTKTIA